MDKICLRAISKKWGKVTAVDSIDLYIKKGEFLTLLGPSGCGKTTTLRMIAGLEEPTAGEISLESKMLFSREKGVYVPPESRNLGFMFQSYALWPHLDVTKNITLGLESKKIPSDEIKSRVDDVLDKVQLRGYENRFPSEMSGGQQQRVALARMIAAKADIFLMDEPLSNLDAMLRVDMRSELKHIHNELEATTVYVTHDQIEALTLSDRIVVMNNGKILQCDNPETIYKKPRNLFVAKFVGSPPINLIKGNVRRVENTVFFMNEDIKLDLSGLSNLPDTSKEVVLGVRAENVNLLNNSEKNKGQPFTVYSVLPAGSETIVKLQRGDIYLAVTLSGFANLSIDDAVMIDINMDTVSFYDSDSEELIC